MKKLLMLVISLFCLNGLIAQDAYTILVKWTPTYPACACSGTATDSSHVVNVYIRDVANSVTVVDKDETASGTDTQKVVGVSEVDDYCADVEEYEEAPVFYILATVSKKCTELAPVTVCDGEEPLENKTCGEFLYQLTIDVDELD